MKIGILTFHDGFNHGSYLQAFFLYQFLLQNGYECEIISYKNRRHFLNELRVFVWVKNPFRLIENLRNIYAFRRAHKAMKLQRLMLDPRKIGTEYDAIIVGSDTVWNYKDPFLGSDPVYFGEGLSVPKLISYAPSFGTVNLEDVAPEFVAKGIKKFDYLSVRDVGSAHIVSRLTGRKAQLVLDPTFLVDSREFQSKIEFGEPYLLVYAYSLRATEVLAAIDFARQRRLRIISIGYHNGWADLNVMAVDPFDWLSYFDAAAFVLTSTFHGTVFSIKYRKNFATSLNENIRNKTLSLLKSLDLDYRLIEDLDVADVFSKEINYAQVERLLAPQILQSRDYLLDALANP